MGVLRYIPAIDQYNLVSFIQTRDTNVSLWHESNTIRLSHFKVTA